MDDINPVVKFSRNGVSLPVSGVPPPKVISPPLGFILIHTVFFGFSGKSLQVLPPDVRF